MDFLNQQIDIRTLPDAGEVDWCKIEKEYLFILRFQWVITSIILFIVATIILFFSGLWQNTGWMLTIVAVCIFLSAFLFLYHTKSFAYRAYAVREHDVLYRHGWLIRSTDACPFNRVQHCSVNSGPLERKYKLASLTLYTAASGEADMKISGIPESKAFEIREYVMKKIVPYESAGA